MECVRQIISSEKLNDIFILPQAMQNKKLEVIIFLAEEKVQEKPKRQLGFAKGAEVPDSFFEPLPEEELQLWGL